MSATLLAVLWWSAASCDGPRTITLGKSAAPPSGGTDGLESGGGSSGGGSSGGGSSGGASAGASGEGGGAGELPLLSFSEPQVVAELSSSSKDENPTLTADQLLLCMTSDREGGSGDVDVWCATRVAFESQFEAPEPLVELNTEHFESSSALSRDGLTVWVGSEREGGQGQLDIWYSERSSRAEAFGPPQVVQELNTTFDDIPRPPGGPYETMPLASRRDDQPYLTYLSDRSQNGTFSPPLLVSGLADDDDSVVDAHLSEDGLVLLFNRAPDGDDPGNLYVAVRAHSGEPFHSPELIFGVNSDSDDRDPWLSPDGTSLYFASDRGGDFDIYRAVRRD